MSELKEWTASEIEEYDDARLELAEDGKIDCTRVYIKQDVDKVIAELEENHKKEVEQLLIETKRLENLCASYRHDCDNLAIREANALKEIGRDNRVIRHQKYKRCLAMVRWCDEVMMSCELRGYAVHRIWANKHQWAMRWKYKWLENAKQFKEYENGLG